MLDPGSRFGPYEIRERLGAGGMGEVYLAWDPRLAREVALKFLSDEDARRLLDEARHGARIEHPNVCPVYDVGEHDGRAFIAMQRVPGTTLEERGPLPEPIAITLALQVAQALAHAHAQGVLHRDLKAANVMVTPEGRAVVLDFGIARALSAPGDESTVTRTMPGVVKGTPSVMSPEQARGEPLDERSDIFSFGVLLYRMLSGRNPFEGATSADAIAAVLTKEPEPLRTTNAELARIVHKCLEKDRDLRYSAMREVATDLERLRRGTTTTVTAPPRRRSAKRAAIVALVLAIAAVIAFAVLKPGRKATDTVRTLAVLPFRPLTEASAESYIGLGIADAVIARLSRDTALIVRPTSAIRRYASAEATTAKAGRDLQVEAVLEGTWQREGDRVRVTANLLRTSDNVSLWSDRFDAESGDLFEVQDRISDQLADRLSLTLGTAARTGGGTKNAAAYEEYSKGLYYFSERGYTPETRANSDQAMRLFAEAVRLDPGFARAHAQLAWTYLWTALFIDTDSTLIDRAEAELAVAERLDPGLAIVPLVRSQILYSRYRGWKIADGIAELRRARALEPGIGEEEWSDFALHLGMVDEWKKALERALAQDPLNRRLRILMVNNAYLMIQPELGRKLQKQLLGEEPDLRYWSIVLDVPRSVADAEAYARAHPQDPVAGLDLAAVAAMQGRCTESAAGIARWAPLQRKGRSYHHQTYEVAETFGLCGNAVDAVRWLRMTEEWGYPAYPLFERDPWLAPIRKSPEFTAYMAELKPRWQSYRAAYLAP